MPIESICDGCAHEQACGRAGVTDCPRRAPARWCSCDLLRRAEADAKRYREKAMRYSCEWKSEADDRCDGTPGDCAKYPCEAVKEEVEG